MDEKVFGKELTKTELLDLYADLDVVRRMMNNRKAPQSMVSRVTEARLAVSWLVDHRD